MRNGKTVLAEVGCGPMGMCFGALVWSQPNTHVLLFEPHPIYAKQIREAAAGRDNVELYEVAIGDEPGTLRLLDEGTSSSLQGVASPAAQHKGDHETPAFDVRVALMSEFDKGDIDLLRVDTEGAEWFCIKHLISRPEQIVVEIYNDLATYINPHLYDIERWAEQNGYKRANVHEGDFVYVRSPDRTVGIATTPVSVRRDNVPPLSHYETSVRQLVIANYANAFYGKMPPDQFVDTLSRIFRFKTKVLTNLATYVQNEARKGHSADLVLRSLDFFGVVLAEFVDKNQHQPLKR